MIRELIRRRRLSTSGRCRPPTWTPSRVAAEQVHPRLGVWHAAPGFWWWQVTSPGGELLDSGHRPTHAEALAVGLAALELANLGPVD